MRFCLQLFAFAFLSSFLAASSFNFSSSVLAPEDLVSVSQIPEFPTLVPNYMYYSDMTFNLTVPSQALANFAEKSLTVFVLLGFSSNDSPAYFFDFERKKRSLAFNLTCLVANGSCVYSDSKRVGIYAIYSGNSSGEVKDELLIQYSFVPPVQKDFFGYAGDFWSSIQSGFSTAWPTFAADI